MSPLGNRFVYDFPGNSVTFIRLHDPRTDTAVEAKVAPGSVPVDASANVIAQLPGITGKVRPTGTVTVTAGDGTVLGTVDVDSRRSAVHFRVSADELGVGTHELIVSYSGDAHFKPSSDTVDLTVTPAQACLPAGTDDYTRHELAGDYGLYEYEFDYRLGSKFRRCEHHKTPGTLIQGSKFPTIRLPRIRGRRPAVTTPADPPGDPTGDDPDNHGSDDHESDDMPEGLSGAPVALPDDLADVPPGPLLGELLDEVSVEAISGFDTVTVLMAAYRQLCHQQAVFYEILVETGLRAPGSVKTVQRGSEPSEFSCEEARAALVWSRTRASTAYSLAYAVCVRLPVLGKAMKRRRVGPAAGEGVRGLDRRVD